MKTSYMKYFFLAAVNLGIKSAEMKSGELSAQNMWLSLTKPHFLFLEFASRGRYHHQQINVGLQQKMDGYASRSNVLLCSRWKERSCFKNSVGKSARALLLFLLKCVDFVRRRIQTSKMCPRTNSTPGH